MNKEKIGFSVILLLQAAILSLILCGCEKQPIASNVVIYRSVETYSYIVTETIEDINRIPAEIDDSVFGGVTTHENHLSSNLTADLQIDIYESKEKMSEETQSEILLVETYDVEPILISDNYQKYFQIYKDIPLEDHVKELLFEYCECLDVPVYMAIACMDLGSHFDINFHNELQLRWGLMCTRWDFVPAIYYNPITRTAEIPVEVSLEVGIDALKDYIECTGGDFERIALCFEWGGIASARNWWKSGGELSEFSKKLVDKFHYYKSCEENYVQILS